MKIFFVVKEGLSGLTSAALVEKGNNCVDMLTGNASFTFPVGFLASIAPLNRRSMHWSNTAWIFARIMALRASNATWRWRWWRAIFNDWELCCGNRRSNANSDDVALTEKPLSAPGNSPG